MHTTYSSDIQSPLPMEFASSLNLSLVSLDPKGTLRQACAFCGTFVLLETT